MATLIHTFKKVVEESKVISLPHYSQRDQEFFHINICETITVINIRNGWFSLAQAAPGVKGYNSLKDVALNSEPLDPGRFHEALDVIKSGFPNTNPSTNKP